MPNAAVGDCFEQPTLQRPFAGGFGGALVLQATTFDLSGKAEPPSVIKVSQSGSAISELLSVTLSLR